MSRENLAGEESRRERKGSQRNREAGKNEKYEGNERKRGKGGAGVEEERGKGVDRGGGRGRKGRRRGEGEGGRDESGRRGGGGGRMWGRRGGSVENEKGREIDRGGGGDNEGGGGERGNGDEGGGERLSKESSHRINEGMGRGGGARRRENQRDEGTSPVEHTPGNGEKYFSSSVGKGGGGREERGGGGGGEGKVGRRGRGQEKRQLSIRYSFIAYFKRKENTFSRPDISKVSKGGGRGRKSRRRGEGEGGRDESGRRGGGGGEMERRRGGSVENENGREVNRAGEDNEGGGRGERRKEDESGGERLSKGLSHRINVGMERGGGAGRRENRRDEGTVQFTRIDDVENKEQRVGKKAKPLPTSQCRNSSETRQIPVVQVLSIAHQQPRSLTPVMAHQQAQSATPVMAHQRPQSATPVMAHQRPQSATPVMAHQQAQSATPVMVHQRPQSATPVMAHLRPQSATPVMAHLRPQSAAPVMAHQRSRSSTPVMAHQRPQSAKPVMAHQRPQSATPVMAHQRSRSSTPVMVHECYQPSTTITAYQHSKSYHVSLGGDEGKGKQGNMKNHLLSEITQAISRSQTDARGDKDEVEEEANLNLRVKKSGVVIGPMKHVSSQRSHLPVFDSERNKKETDNKASASTPAAAVKDVDLDLNVIPRTGPSLGMKPGLTRRNLVARSSQKRRPPTIRESLLLQVTDAEKMGRKRVDLSSNVHVQARGRRQTIPNKMTREKLSAPISDPTSSLPAYPGARRQIKELNEENMMGKSVEDNSSPSLQTQSSTSSTAAIVACAQGKGPLSKLTSDKKEEEEKDKDSYGQEGIKSKHLEEKEGGGGGNSKLLKRGSYPTSRPQRKKTVENPVKSLNIASEHIIGPPIPKKCTSSARTPKDKKPTISTSTSSSPSWASSAETPKDKKPTISTSTSSAPSWASFAETPKDKKPTISTSTSSSPSWASFAETPKDKKPTISTSTSSAPSWASSAETPKGKKPTISTSTSSTPSWASFAESKKKRTSSILGEEISPKQEEKYKNLINSEPLHTSIPSHPLTGTFSHPDTSTTSHTHTSTPSHSDTSIPHSTTTTTSHSRDDKKGRGRGTATDLPSRGHVKDKMTLFK